MGISSQSTMFYGAKPDLFEKAKVLRQNMTEAESLVWELLKGNKMLGLHFRAQHPIDIFIADFYCHRIRLVIEVDGGIHQNRDQKDYDIARTEELGNWGVEVIRFTNDQIKNNLGKVKQTILTECRQRIKKIGNTQQRTP